MSNLKVRNLIARDLFPIPDNVAPENLRCVKIHIPDDPEHLAIFAGAFRLLTLWNSWQKDGTTNARDAANAWKEAYRRGIQDCTECDEVENECITYRLDDNDLITWAPQDPFRQPGYKPEGYANVPFVLLDDIDLIDTALGFQKGDILTGFFGIPVITPALDEGLARFRVRCKGTGVVELHLLKMPLGGQVLITQDDDPFTANIVSLYKDPTSLPLEITTEIVIEVKFEEPGSHHVDVTFLARFDDELTFFTYGGGVRSVVLCGFDPMKQDGGIDIEEGDCMRLRIHPDDPCIIQHECSPGVWENWYDPRACIGSSVVVQPSPGGDLPEFECSEYDVTLRASDRWLLPVPVSDGYTVQISDVSGGWNDSSLQWSCPDGRQYFLGICGTQQPAQETDPLQTVNHMRLIAEVDGVFYDAYNTTITVPAGTEDTQLYFQANDGSLEGNQGSVSFHVKVCNTGGGALYEQLVLDSISDAAVVSSFETDITKLYKITLSGNVQTNYPANPDTRNDAFYFTEDDWDTHDRPDRITACPGDKVEIQIDGNSFPSIPDYSDTHSYVVYRQGTGNTFSFNFCDVTGAYSDNNGVFTITIELA